LERDLHDKLVRRFYLLYLLQASPEEHAAMCEPMGWRPPLPRDLPRQIRYLEARVAHGERGDGIPLITHKYRGSQQSSREVKPKFIDSTQGEVKNTYKP
jgi:hypothetical protein